jgi:hypothetical protein
MRLYPADLLQILQVCCKREVPYVVLDILVDLKSAKPYGRSLSCASARLPVIGRQTLSPLGSAPCLQRHYIREEATLGDLKPIHL